MPLLPDVGTGQPDAQRARSKIECGEIDSDPRSFLYFKWELFIEKLMNSNLFGWIFNLCSDHGGMGMAAAAT